VKITKLNILSKFLLGEVFKQDRLLIVEPREENNQCGMEKTETRRQLTSIGTTKSVT
jgi:hypothetical protein